jgi:hypothetical protein
MSEQASTMHQTMMDIRDQLKTRRDVHEFMVHAVKHMQLYTKIVGSHLLQITEIPKSYLNKVETSMTKAIEEVSRLETKMERCEITPEQLQTIIASGNPKHELIETYRTNDCYESEKGFQLRKAFQKSVETWWETQRKLLKEMIHDQIARRDSNYLKSISEEKEEEEGEKKISQKKLWELQNATFSSEKHLAEAKRNADEAIDALFAEHQPIYLVHKINQNAVHPAAMDSKKFWKLEDEKYEQRLSEAAGKLFLRADSWFGATLEHIKIVVKHYWKEFQTQVLEPLNTMYNRLDKRWKVVLGALAIAAILVAVTAGSVFIVASSAASSTLVSVGSGISIATAQYTYALTLIKPYCFVFFQLETLVGVTYAMRVLLGSKSELSQNASAIVDSQYPYCSPVLNTILDFISDNDFFEGFRSMIVARFKIAPGEANAQMLHLKSILSLDDNKKQDAGILKILFQCIFWANFVLSFACESKFSALQVNADYADKTNKIVGISKPYFEEVGKLVMKQKQHVGTVWNNYFTSSSSEKELAFSVEKKMPSDASHFLNSYLEQLLLLFRVQMI